MSESTIVVFGADSDPGFRLAQLAVRAGHTAVGVIRRAADRGPLERLGAQVVVANPLQPAEVAAVFAGRDGAGLTVVCFIGGTPQLNSQGNINVIAAAEAARVQRLVLTTSIGCGDSAAVLDPFVKAFAGKSIRAKDWAESRLKASTLDWTIVRSGGMTVRPGKGGPILVESNQVVGYINRTELGDAVYLAATSPKASRRIFAAVDRSKAMDINGGPLVPADLA